MTQEALKLSLDALLHAYHEDEAHPRTLEAITAIKEALAQPEQEPLKIFQYNCTCGRTMKFESVHGVVAPQRTEQNFCSRCGKRVGGIDSIHTCTPPMEMNT
jgi:predicted SprT family Zn-dependent metalloprotease